MIIVTATTLFCIFLGGHLSISLLNNFIVGGNELIGCVRMRDVDINSEMKDCKGGNIDIVPGQR